MGTSVEQSVTALKRLPSDLKIRFVIFSLPRCGSTTLRRILNCHTGIRCLEEPFNPFNYGGRYLRQVSKTGTLDETLSIIWSAYNGIKHTWYPDGWPFADAALNKRFMLKTGQRVVFLQRRNMLRRLVSTYISNQTNVWGLYGQTERERVASFRYAPLDADAVARRLDWEKRMLAEYKRVLAGSNIPILEVSHEDVYESAAGFAKVNEILAFVGAGPIHSQAGVAEAARLLNPTVMRLNSEEVYRRIPGIDAVERRCGSDETGWLFDA